jgi:protein regulator of cytokinesis 1
MQTSLEGKERNSYDFDDDMKVTYPLKPCLDGLKEKHKMVHKLHRERYEQVRKLAQAIESYSSHLEPSFTKVKLPPTSPNAACPPTFDLSHAYFSSLDDEFSRVYEEYERRLASVKSMCSEIINLWAELGTPQAQTDSNIVALSREAPEQLGLHAEDLKRLQTRRDRLVEEKKGRERRLKELRTQIEALWDRLRVDQADRKGFLAANRGCGMRTINEFEDELNRLNELKRQNLGLFVEDARVKLQELWDSLYFSEEEMLEFTPAFSGQLITASGRHTWVADLNPDVYSDALLSAHEAELERLEALREQRAPTLAMVDKHRSLVKERDDLAASSQDASRLMLRGQKGEKRDPGKLLREEKMRKRITKELPKVEADLRKVLEAWEDEYGRPFLVHGERYIDELDAAQAKVAPPRSKTPSIPAGAPKQTTKTTTTKVPLKGEPTAKSGTVRGAPPSRAKTPTNFGSTIRGSAPPSTRGGDTVKSRPATVKSANKSPTRIPARAPLSNLQHGNNSPERHYQSSTVKMGPPRLPPPKMQDLFSKSQLTPTLGREYSNENFERSASIVRQTQPEDPYDDRAGAESQMSQHSYMSRSMYNPSQASHYSMSSNESNYQAQSVHSGRSYAHNQHPREYPMAPPSRPQSRQISGQSASSNNSQPSQVSGSENWETYDDVSEPEADATNAYYAKLRQQASHGKRPTPEGGYAPSHSVAGKKPRGLMGNGGMSMVVEGEGGHMVDGSDAGWTDEDGF